MAELYENPACSGRMMKRLLNSHVSLKNINYSSIHSKLRDLIGEEISIEHVRTIINSWSYYQALINMSSKTNFKKIKQKINKLITIRDDILLALFDHDISVFEQSSGIFSIFGKRDNILQFSETLNRKKGSPYSNSTLKKQCYFELLFIAESLGLVRSDERYKSNDLKTFLDIISEPLLEVPEEEETLWYYCQEYYKAKEQPKIKEMLPALVEHCIEFRFNAPIWQKLLNIYQDQISPLMLTQ